MNLGMENNQPHKFGANSTLYNVAIMGISIIFGHYILNCSCLCCWYKMLICIFNIFIYFHQLSQYKILNLWCHVTRHTEVLNTIGLFQDVSKISSRYSCVRKYTCHRRVYTLLLALIYTVFWHFICFCRFVHIRFRIFRVAGIF